VERLRHGEGIRAQPVRRVLIPKAGKPGEWRPLGIPMCPAYCTSLRGVWGWGRCAGRPLQYTAGARHAGAGVCAGAPACARWRWSPG
jgi:hypothetical protein